MTFGGFHVGIIDVVIVLLTLIFAISGFKNGLFKEITGIAVFFAAIALSVLLASLVEDILINGSTVYQMLFDNLSGSVFTGNAAYEIVLDSTQPDILTTIATGLTQIGIPDFISSTLAPNLGLGSFDGTLGNGLATAASYFIVLIASYLGTFLVAWLLLLILTSQIKKLIKDFKFFKFIDSVLGIGLGLVRGAVVVGIILFIAILVSSVVPQVSEFINADLSTDTEVFSIGKTIYEFATSLLSPFLSL
jgi:uncharacterized membrane protein required for colicin V production